MQLTSPRGMFPPVVGDANVQSAVSTTVPAGCSTVTTADVNATATIVSVHSGFGQSGAPGIGDSGASVVTANDRLPFLISSAGIDSDPVSSTGAGF